MSYEGFARLELMGHRTRVGFIREGEMYGGKLLRIDIPVEGADDITEFYGASAIYAVTPISEAIARDYAKRVGDPRPVKPMDYRLEDQRPRPDDVCDDIEPDDEQFGGD